MEDGGGRCGGGEAASVADELEHQTARARSRQLTRQATWRKNVVAAGLNADARSWF